MQLEKEVTGVGEQNEGTLFGGTSNLGCKYSEDGLQLRLEERAILRKEEICKKQYNVIEEKKRLDLIRKVIVEKCSVRRAADHLQIKFSTAKAILKTFKTEGRVGKKKDLKQQKDSTTPPEEGQNNLKEERESLIKVIEKQKQQQLDSLKRQEQDNKLLLQRLDSIFRSVVVSDDAATKSEYEKDKSLANQGVLTTQTEAFENQIKCESVQCANQQGVVLMQDAQQIKDVKIEEADRNQV